MKEPKVMAVIPAQSGWFELGFCESDQAAFGIDIWKNPIVAWRIMDNDWAEPILAMDITCRKGLLLSPDGQVFDPMVRSWDSLDDFIKSKSKELHGDKYSDLEQGVPPGGTQAALMAG